MIFAKAAPIANALREYAAKAALLLAAILLLCAGGCGIPQRFDAVPSALAAHASFLQIPNARFDGDDRLVFGQELRRAAQREKARQVPDAGAPALLALSGGGEDGAFGAGLLVGWTEHGGRPQFKIVTGTSTGALAAPFAFLGSAFDPTLRKMYTTTAPDDVLAKRFLLAAVNNDGMMDSAPLERSIAKYLDGRILRLIAGEHANGRLLLISTTNLDTGKLVVWNIGAIAASDHPNRLEIVRKIVLASAAVPGVFPPVMLDVLVGESRHQEMHVDGATVSQVFLYPPSLQLSKVLQAKAGARTAAYIIRNGRVSPKAETVERQTLAIAGRAIETMFRSNAVGALYRIYATTQRDHVDFNLALIGDDFSEPYTQAFDGKYMRRLFAYGYAKGRQGYTWQKAPPGFHK
jgi:hypothetical protein